MVPEVTVGIPAYQRTEGLRRALASLALQDYPNIRVIVKDDCSPHNDLAGVVRSFAGKIARLEYLRNPENLGLVENALSLIDLASGKYFMWLADDDEVSPDYISILVRELERDASLSTAFGARILVGEDGSQRRLRARGFCDENAWVRCAKYMMRSDDAFFYGVHRLEVVRRAGFSGFNWPNEEVVTNWCYAFDIDLILAGKVLVLTDTSACWLNHGLTPKHYFAPRRRVVAGLAAVARKLDLQVIYLRKARAVLGPMAPITLAPASIVGLAVWTLAWLQRVPGRVANRWATRPER